MNKKKGWGGLFEIVGYDRDAEPEQIAQSEYSFKAQEFMKRHNIKMRFTYRGISNRLDKKNYSDEFRVLIKREGYPSMSVLFNNSLHDTIKVIPPTPYDVLACLMTDSYAVDSYEDFCNTYGYEPDEKDTETVYNNCKKEAEDVAATFDGIIDELAEIQ